MSTQATQTLPIGTSAPRAVCCDDGFGCLFVVACSSKKTAALKAGPTAARDAYDGQAFKTARRLLENAGAKWCVLSGKYGFLWPDSIIENYNEKMDADPERPWDGEFDSLKQKQYGRLMNARRIVVLGSRLYADSAAVMLRRPVEAPLAGLPIGKMLQRLARGSWLSHPNAESSHAGAVTPEKH